MKTFFKNKFLISIVLILSLFVQLSTPVMSQEQNLKESSEQNDSKKVLLKDEKEEKVLKKSTEEADLENNNDTKKDGIEDKKEIKLNEDSKLEKNDEQDKKQSKDVSSNPITPMCNPVDAKICAKLFKEWNGGLEPRPTVKFQLFRDGVKYGDPKELVHPNTALEWNNLPKFKDGTKVESVYTVVEEDIEAYRTVQYVPSHDSAGNIIFKFENCFEIDKIDITARKTWIGGPNVRPTVWFKLYRNLPNGPEQEVPNAEVKELSNGVTEVTWDDLDKTDFYGKVYTYYVKEGVLENGVFTPKAPDKYTVLENGLEVINTYNVPTVDITGMKVWEGGPTPRPTIKLQLFKNGKPEGPPVELVDGVTEYTWTNLEKFDENGKPYIYTVNEVDVPENYIGEKETCLIVKNKYVPPKIEIKGTKTWEGGATPRPTIKLQLFKNGKPEGAPVELVDGVTEYVWKNLDKTDKNGVAYVYTVDEVDIPENYNKIKVDDLTVKNKYVPPKIEIKGTKIWEGGATPRPTIKLQLFKNGKPEGAPVKLVDGVTEYVWKNLDKTDENGVDYVYTVGEVDVPENYIKTNVDNLTVKNKYVPPKTEIKGTKVWEGGATPRPTIKLQLFKNGKPEGAPVELVDGVTEYVWKNLDKTDENGVDYVYKVDEVDVPENYDKIKVDDLTVKNKYVPPKTDIEVVKKWIGPKLQEIYVKLFADGVEVDGMTIVLNEKNGWKAEFKDLDLYTKDGVKIEYTVKEVENEHYEVEISGDVENGFIITNRNVEKIDIPVEKKWNGAILDEILVILKANDVKVNEIILNESLGWKGVFKDLPKYDEKGNPIVYTVEEDILGGYEVEITGDAENGFVIINTPKKKDPKPEDEEKTKKKKTFAKTGMDTTILNNLVLMGLTTVAILELKKRNKK